MMKRFFRWIRKTIKPASKEINPMMVLLDKIARTESQEFSCDDVHAVLAEFAERRQQGEAVSHLMPKVQQHLELCPDCREEYEALLMAMEAENELI